MEEQVKTPAIATIPISFSKKGNRWAKIEHSIEGANIGIIVQGEQGSSLICRKMERSKEQKELILFERKPWMSKNGNLMFNLPEEIPAGSRMYINSDNIRIVQDNPAYKEPAKAQPELLSES